MNTTTTLPELVSSAHIGMIVNAIGQAKVTYPMYNTIGKMRQKSETQVRYAGGGIWLPNNEGASFNATDVEEGDTVTFTAQRFDQSYKITHEMMMDDLYNVIDSGQGQGNSATNFGRGLLARIEKDCADVINDGFSTTGYDGANLFANAQTCINSSDTWDNLLAVALSSANLATAEEQMREQVNDDGTHTNASGDTLIVARNLEFTARGILSDTDTNLNSTVYTTSKNTTPQYKLVVVNDLTDGYWVLKDSSVKNLELRWRERPIFGTQNLEESIDIIIYGYARYSVGYSEKRGLVGSSGA